MIKKSEETFFEYPDFNNIKEILYYSEKKYSNKVAFKLKERKDKEVIYKEITYKEFISQANQLGTGLYNLGLKGKKIAIISKNRYEWILSFTSIILGEMVAVPLDKDFTEIELRNALLQSQAEAIIYDKKYEETLEKLKNDTELNLKHLISMDKQTNEENIYDVSEVGKLQLQNSNKEFLNTKIKDKELSILVFTSGTTAESKAVMLSQYNIAKNIHDMMLVEQIRDDDVNLAFLPYHHTFGLTGQLVMLSAGATTVYPEGLKYVKQNLKEYGVTIFVCVPKLIEAIYAKLLNEIEKQGKTNVINIAKILTNLLLKFKIDIRRRVFKQVINELGGIRTIISGAAGLNKSVAKGFNDLGILTVQGYGLTETSPVLAAENYKYRNYGSIGFPLKSVTIEIDNKDENGIGEIKAKGPNVMLGYYKNDKATSEVIKDGWFYTGDLGYKDREGYIFITGRKKNMIVLKNGKKIFPEELEDLINQIDLVEESFVFGMKKGEDVLLSVKIKYDKNILEEKYKELNNVQEIEKIIWEKIKEKNKLLPKYKYIKNMILTDEEFIKTSTQKIKRHEEMKKILNNI